MQRAQTIHATLAPGTETTTEPERTVPQVAANSEAIERLDLRNDFESAMKEMETKTGKTEVRERGIAFESAVVTKRQLKLPTFVKAQSRSLQCQRLHY